MGWATTVSVQPRAPYRLSGWIKTEHVQSLPDRGGRGALLNVHDIQPVATPPSPSPETELRVEMIFETERQ